ncbi:MAG: hypothetical protein WKF50_13270 [Nocardioides sp.]
MEITARPRRRGWLRAVRALVGAGALLAVALLIPLALGYQTHVVDDHAMAGTHARGSLVFDEQVSQRQLEVGDVVTFVPPGAAPADGTVTRRIVAIDDAAFQTRGDAAAAVDPWRVPLADGDLERVAFSLPWAGYPVIAVDSLAIPPWALAALALGLAAVLVVLRRNSRPLRRAVPFPRSAFGPHPARRRRVPSTDSAGV